MSTHNIHVQLSIQKEIPNTIMSAAIVFLLGTQEQA